MPQAVVDRTPDAVRRRGWITVVLAVLCMLLTPFGMLMSSGLLTPVGIPPAIVSSVLAVLVVTRTTPGRWPRRFAWAMLGFASIPWLVTIVWLIQLHVEQGS
ncbi:MAG: hypothetical protein GC157_04010 [Frankiales bacterium]|nr:hypothetical protein [Frankiales bacterium]